MKNWFIKENKRKSNYNDLFIIPTFKIWWNKRTFLETGVYTKAIGIKIHLFFWEYSFAVQEGY